MSDTQHVSLDFIASQLQRVLAELCEMKVTLDLDRRNARASFDNLVFEMARSIGSIDVRLDFVVAHFDDRFDQLEQLIKKA